MDEKFKRKRYLVHPSSQFKYIAMSILPALILGSFCIYFLIKSGEFILQAEKDRMSIQFASIYSTMQRVEAKSISTVEIKSDLNVLRRELLYLQNVLKMGYYDALRRWNETKLVMVDTMMAVLLFVGVLALLYSHRIAGPMIRLTRYMEMFATGQDTPPVKFRDYDEFKELADAVEKLRLQMKEKGLLK